MNRKYPKRKDYIIVLCASIFFIIAGTFMLYNFVKELGFLFAIIALGVGIAIGLPIIKKCREWDKLSDKEYEELGKQLKEKFNLKKPLGIICGSILGISTLGAVIGKGIASNIRQYGDFTTQKVFYCTVAFAGIVFAAFFIVFAIYGLKSNRVSEVQKQEQK